MVLHDRRRNDGRKERRPTRDGDTQARQILQSCRRGRRQALPSQPHPSLASSDPVSKDQSDYRSDNDQAKRDLHVRIDISIPDNFSNILHSIKMRMSLASRTIPKLGTNPTKIRIEPGAPTPIAWEQRGHDHGILVKTINLVAKDARLLGYLKKNT